MDRVTATLTSAYGPPTAIGATDEFAQPPAIPFTWIAWGVLGSVAAVGVLMKAAGLWIDPEAISDYPYYVCGGICLAICWGLREPHGRVERAVRDAAEYYALFTLVALVGAIASYPVSVFSHGWNDMALARVDRALGFDWIGWYRVVAAHPALQLLGRLSYQSIYWTPAVILAHFAWTGRKAAARSFLASVWLSAVITLAIFSFIPAVGPLSVLWHGPIPYMPESAVWEADVIPALRQHLVTQVDLGTLRGLVSAPSFHAATGILFIATAWPVRRLRWPVFAVSVAMLLATPVEGTHYLADMIAGMVVAAVALAIVAEVNARLAARAPRSFRNDIAAKP